MIKIFIGTVLFFSLNALCCPTPTRPHFVNKNAVWIGTCESPIWVNISKLEPSKVRVRINFDPDSDISRVGWFEVSPGCKLTSQDSLKNDFKSYDEDILFLKQKSSTTGEPCFLKAAPLHDPK